MTGLQEDVVKVRLEAIDERLDRGSARMDDIEKAVHENTQATLEGNRDAREILEIFQAVKGGIRVLGWIGTVARWASYVAAGALAVYKLFHIVKTGDQPPKP